MGNDLGVEAGQVIADKYRVQRLLGRGGMGSVWQCEHLSLMSQVAVKVIKPQVAKNKNSVARFMREAKAAAMLRSPHVVQILDHGTDGDIAFIVMELLEGESLHERLKRGPLGPAEAATVLTHVGRAMQRAHDAGVVHRDLKPDNIFLVHNDDEVMGKVLDFGIAKSAIGALNITGESPQTQTGALLGTPYYMSPEQATGQKDVDHRSDLWAIGVIAFESLIGKRPYQSDSLGDLVLQICSRPQPVPSRRGSVPEGFDAWFAKANHRDPDQRYGSAREMTQDLRGILLGRATLPSMTTMPQHAPSATTSPQGSQLPLHTEEAPASTTRDPNSEAAARPVMPFASAGGAEDGASSIPAGSATATAPGTGIAPTVDAPSAPDGEGVADAALQSGSDAPGLQTLDPLSATQTPTARRRMAGWLAGGTLAVVASVVAIITLGGSPDDGEPEASVSAQPTTGTTAEAARPEPTATEEPMPHPEPSATPTTAPSAQDSAEPATTATATTPPVTPHPPPRPRPVIRPTPRPPPPKPSPKDPLAI